jgi:hypothetical protein
VAYRQADRAFRLTRRKRKPPEQIAQEAQERAAREREVRLLQRQPDVRVNHDQQFRIRGARRIDCIALLHERRSITDDEHNAYRRLEADMIEAAGLGSKGDSEYVDCAQAFPPGQAKPQRMFDAGRRVQEVIGKMDAELGALVRELADPWEPNAALTRWRDTVRRITPVKDKTTCGAIVALACRALERAYR